MKKPIIGIVIPAYNEEKRIGKTLEAYSSFLDKKSKEQGFDYSLFIVINNTTDNTEQVVRAYKKKNNKIDLVNLQARGKGYAVIEGFKILIKKNYDFIGFVDADMATPPEAYYLLIEEIRKGGDGVIASRYLPDSVLNPKMSFRRLMVGKLFNLYFRMLFFMPFTDTQCGAKLFRREALSEVVSKVKMSQWAFDVELLYELHVRERKINEVSTVWFEVAGGSIKIIKSSLQMIFSLLQLRMYKSPFRRLLTPFRPLVLLMWKRLKDSGNPKLIKNRRKLNT